MRYGVGQTSGRTKHRVGPMAKPNPTLRFTRNICITSNHKLGNKHYNLTARLSKL